MASAFLVSPVKKGYALVLRRLDSNVWTRKLSWNTRSINEVLFDSSILAHT